MTGADTAGGTGDRAALDRLLGVPEMAWLVTRVRPRILSVGDEPLSGVVQLNTPSPAQGAAAARLVGRPSRPGPTLRVDLAVVEEILRRGPWPAGLADAVETLTGPVIDRKADREREAAAWDAARDGLASVAARFPQLSEWWEAWCAAGGLKRAARAEAARTSTTPSSTALSSTAMSSTALLPAVGADLVTRVSGVFELLPASGVPLAVVARQTVGDAHGLDASRPLGRLAAAVVRAAFMPEVASSDGELSARDVWEAAGVVLSNVASTVLCLGVPGATGADAEGSGQVAGTATAATGAATATTATATATALEAMRAARMPVLLTLDHVRSGGVRTLSRGRVIHVCENPTVVEIVAERWARFTAGDGGTAGEVGPVLVCTSGQPSTAVIELLKILAGDGAECRYHGDFDWAGLRIARFVSGHVAWTPWRYTAADYRAAVQDEGPSRHLTGSPADSPWDVDLAATMAEHGLAVEEEAVADLLAADVLGDSA